MKLFQITLSDDDANILEDHIENGYPIFIGTWDNVVRLKEVTFVKEVEREGKVSKDSTTGQKQIKAADDLEALASDMKMAVVYIREHAVNNSHIAYSYAKVYRLRTRLGRIVATLGVGVPFIKGDK